MQYVIGIDEVGRGALAGPVVVAAALVPRGFVCRRKRLGALRDSKKLSAGRRETWAEYFAREPKIQFAFARVYPRQIEKQNISRAANLAAHRACKKLSEKYLQKRHNATFPDTKIILDGGLYLRSRAAQPKSATTLIKADEKIPAVAIASIVAKVHRDDYMRRLARRHPAYGFEVNKGYGTRAHAAAIRKYGPSEAHRLTFLKPTARI